MAIVYARGPFKGTIKQWEVYVVRWAFEDKTDAEEKPMVVVSRDELNADGALFAYCSTKLKSAKASGPRYAQYIIAPADQAAGFAQDTHVYLSYVRPILRENIRYRAGGGVGVLQQPEIEDAVQALDTMLPVLEKHGGKKFHNPDERPSLSDLLGEGRKKLRKYGGRQGEGTFRAMRVDEFMKKFGPGTWGGGEVWMVGHDGSARRIRSSGKMKTWKRQPDRFEVPFKYGKYESLRITDEDVKRGDILVEVFEAEENPRGEHDPSLEELLGESGCEWCKPEQRCKYRMCREVEEDEDRKRHSCSSCGKYVCCDHFEGDENTNYTGDAWCPDCITELEDEG